MHVHNSPRQLRLGEGTPAEIDLSSLQVHICRVPDSPVCVRSLTRDWDSERLPRSLNAPLVVPARARGHAG
jgi:hypothetical protein